MASIETRIIELAEAVGYDVKGIRNQLGNLPNLTTTEKLSLVGAINELKSAVSAVDLTALINDAAASSILDKTYSANKIVSLIGALKTELMGGIPASTLDTIKELADYLATEGVAGGVVEQLGMRVRADAYQTFDVTQQETARANIGAASQADLNMAWGDINNMSQTVSGMGGDIGNIGSVAYAVETNLGYTGADPVAVYAAAKA